MKLVNFFKVKGFDPKRCRPSNFYKNVKVNAKKKEVKACSVCPIAKAAELRGYKPSFKICFYQQWSQSWACDDTVLADDIKKKFKLDDEEVQEFVSSYDEYDYNDKGKKSTLTERFNIALQAVKDMAKEKKAEAKR